MMRDYKVVMVSDAFQGGCVCENAAGLRIGTDNVEFAALTAPRHAGQLYEVTGPRLLTFANAAARNTHRAHSQRFVSERKKQ